MKDGVKEKLEVTVRGQRLYFWSDTVKKKLALQINYWMEWITSPFIIEYTIEADGNGGTKLVEVHGYDPLVKLIHKLVLDGAFK